MIRQAFVLAAGLGKRLNPLTLEIPKPLIKIHEECCLDFVFKHLYAYGVEKIVINTHHLAHQIHDHLSHARYSNIIISHEEKILESGGGIKNALNYLDDEPFFVVNADIMWEEGAEIFYFLEQRYNSNMAALLALIPLQKSLGGHQQGDYYIDKNSRLIHKERLLDKKELHIASSVQLTHPQNYLRDDLPTYFSNRQLWDVLEAENRLYGAIYDKKWIDIGSIENLEIARKNF